MDMFTILESMSKDQRDGIIKEIDKQLVDLPDAMISQGAVSFVKNEYNEIGIDTDNMQTLYPTAQGILPKTKIGRASCRERV